jgi:hypothetical protein
MKQGVVAGFDQKSNVVLSDSKERIYSMDEGVEEIPLGLYLVKGDQMYVITYPYFAVSLNLTISITIQVCSLASWTRKLIKLLTCLLYTRTQSHLSDTESNVPTIVPDCLSGGL